MRIVWLHPLLDLEALQRGVENQGVPFVPGLHTRWVFHGSSAVDPQRN